MINFERKSRYTYEDLLEVIHLLRSPEGCPWDKVQTHQSIRREMLEEAYEAVEAIDLDDPALLREELGDVLMQVVFHADIESDAGRFNMEDVVDEITKKMIYRHPHVFADAHEDSPESVLVSWDILKRKEKGQETTTDAMDSVARTLPGLWRAEKIQKKAAKTGFDWPDISGAMDKLDEEVGELRQAIEQGTNVFEELGDVLFAAVKVGRFAGVDCEEAIAATCEKFIRRFCSVENSAAAQGRTMEELSLDEMIALWNKAKES
ncbi:MAG: nucleoside triphosphate pyrophosphohydrolase [Clostridiales bacterium]|nr:nucleoside triphosphate pyrophosphohydrolase [Candidatus Cacconaster stercorequi]